MPSVGENIRRGPQSALLPAVKTKVGSIGDALATSAGALSVWTLSCSNTSSEMYPASMCGTLETAFQEK